MDIYGAEQNAKKLLKYVQDIAANKSRMYGPTRSRLKNVASSCEQIFKLLSGYLEGEILAAEEEEEFERDNSDIQEMLSNIQSEISQLQNFISLPQSSSEKSEKLSTQNKKKLVSVYYDMISKSKCVDSEAAQECLDILKLWYTRRFFESQNTGFRYNVKKIPSWIISIVLAYGKSIHDGNQSSFVYTFTSWCNMLKDSDPPIPYALPYDIFQISVSPGKDDMTLNAVVLWDLLWASGFSRFDETEEIPMESVIYKQCGELNPSELDRYRSYQDDPDILQECKLNYSSSGGEVI